jgi:4-hydroxy-3-polyprenylbenzoate decarboxylase
VVKKRIIVGITGASGSLYAYLLLERLRDMQEQLDEVAIVVSETAEKVWPYELPDLPLNTNPFKKYSPGNFFSPVASGSSGFDAMIIIPCSVGTMGRIAAGTASDLMIRAADVILKERKKLILVLRETPYSRIHIQNMLSITDAGGIICPASPGFYGNPKTMEDLCMTVVNRALSLAGLNTAVKGFMQ